MRPDERLLEVHISLNQKRVSHDFYALIPTGLLEKMGSEGPAAVAAATTTGAKPKEFSDKMFKEGSILKNERKTKTSLGKWDRVGELFKAVEDEKDAAAESGGKKPLLYSKRTFYLGKDILYYISKERTQFFILALLKQEPQKNNSGSKSECDPFAICKSNC